MSDAPRDPSLEGVFTAHGDAVLRSMHGCLPGVIVSYDPATGSASVQPSIMEGEIDENEDRVTAVLPIINDVPVWAFGTAQVRIKLPLAAGDPVLIVWAGRSLDVWKQTSGGGPVDPGNDSSFDYNDCFCFPGRPSFQNISDHPAQIEFTSNTVNIGGTNRLVTKADFDAHTHAVATTGTSTAQTGTAAPPAPAVGTPVLRG